MAALNDDSPGRHISGPFVARRIEGIAGLEYENEEAASDRESRLKPLLRAVPASRCCEPR